MVCARVVLNLVLNKLKSRQTDPIKREMVRTAGIRDRKRRCAEVSERREPLTKQRTHGFVALQVNATNLAGAVIEIVISTQLLVLGFRGERWSGRSTVSVAPAHSVVWVTRRGRGGGRRVLQRAK